MNHTTTKADLAGRLGVARSTLDRYLQLPAFPKKTKTGWNVESCIEFVKAEGLKEPSHITEERRLLVRAQRMLAEQRLKKESEELVSKDEVKARVARIIGTLVGIVQKTISRQDYDACATQFQKCNFDL